MPGMSRLIGMSAAVLLLASVGIGLWDMLGGLDALNACITLIFVIGAVFNSWAALSSN